MAIFLCILCAGKEQRRRIYFLLFGLFPEKHAERVETVRDNSLFVQTETEKRIL